MAGRCAPGAALRTLPTVAAVRAHARQAQRLGWCCVLLMLTIQAVQWQGALRSSGSMPAPRPAAAAPPAPAPVAAAAAPLLCGGDAKAPRNSTSQGAALLDDIPPSAATNISSYAPVFLALADMAYAFDHVAGSRRRGAAPCLTAWGARGAALEVRAPGDADRRALVFRTRRDVVVTIRGMDGGGSFRAYGDVTPTFDPRYFGAPPSPVPPPPELPQAAYRTRRPFADPDLFWVLRRDYAQLRLLEAPLMEAVDALVMQMDPKARSQHRVWLTGHSSGGALAQLAALRLAALRGPGAVGGVLLFNSDRVGSGGFAAHYDSLLGGRTLRFGYGLDNANLVSNIAMGLRFPGSGFWLCPAAGRATEVLVALPPGGDRVNACAGITPWSRAADLETEDDVSRRWRIPFYPYPVMSTFAEWSSFAHHFPHLLFDGLLRTLGGGLAPCAAAALRLPECAVSDRCSAAVRPEGDTRCRSCADDATCTVYWGLEGHRCDNRPNWSRSGLCYRPPSPLLPFSVPPTLLGLFYDKSRPGGAGARFDAPPRGADGGRRMAPGGEEAGARVQAS